MAKAITKPQIIEELKKYPDVVFNKNATNAVLLDILKAAKQAADDAPPDKPASLKQHEIEALEKVIRKAVRRDGGFVKGAAAKDKEAAYTAIKRLGRKEIAWDRSIDLNMLTQKSRVRRKTSHNSID